MYAAGPRLEKVAVASSRSTAPTVSAAGAQPGDETVLLLGPVLPAAMTNRLLLVVESCCAADASGSVQSPGAPVFAEAHGDDVGALRRRPTPCRR